MANINTNGFIVAAISIIVSIILVTGALIPVIADNSGTERTVLYTNTGEWYYNEVTNDTNTTINFKIEDYADEFGEYAYLMVSIDDGEWVDATCPEWTSENSMDVSVRPLFIFKTNDGKYGVEGLITGCGGIQNAGPEYLKACGGVMYYRFIQGDSEPVIEYPFIAGLSETASVTLSNGQVTVDGFTFPSINAKYELYFVGETSGDYVFSGQPMMGPGMSVINSTDFYCCGWCGSSSIETDMDTGDQIVVYTDMLGSIGKGKVSTIMDSSNISFYVVDDDTSPTFTLNTEPTQDEKGTVINHIEATSDDASIGNIGGFIVPVEIAEGGDSAMSPTLKSMVSVIPLIVIVGLIVGTVGYFLRRQ